MEGPPYFAAIFINQDDFTPGNHGLLTLDKYLGSKIIPSPYGYNILRGKIIIRSFRDATADVYEDAMETKAIIYYSREVNKTKRSLVPLTRAVMTMREVFGLAGYDTQYDRYNL